MKRTKFVPSIVALLAGSALLGGHAYSQLLNPSFSEGGNGLNDWTITGSTTTFPQPDRPTIPPGLSTSIPGYAVTNNGTITVLNERVDGDGLVATAASQTFSLKPIERISGKLGKGVGRLQLSSFGGIKPSATLSLNAQFFSQESIGSLYDYAGVNLNGKPVLRFDNQAGTTTGTFNVPGLPAGTFPHGAAVTNATLNLNSLIGSNPTLTFFVADTGDSVEPSALTVSGLSLSFSYLVEDIDAINSVYASGLPMVLAQRQILLNVAANANRDVNGRLFRLRSGMDLSPEGAAGPSGDGKDVKESKKQIVPEEKRWAFYATGAYGYRDVNNVDLTAGFQSDMFTATIGGDYKLTPNLTIGLAASRIEADNDLGSLGSADIEGWSYDAYVSYATPHFYADLLYALGTYNHQINRNTGFLGETATARPDSLTNSIQFNTGYNIQCGRVITGPLATLNWVHGKIDGYNEQQGGNADLSVPGQEFNSLTTEFGWQASLPVRTGFGVVTPQVRASWVHEYLNESKDVIVGLQNSPYYFVDGTSVSRFSGFNAVGKTSAPGSDYMTVGAGVGFGISDRASVIVDWEAHFFQDHSSSQNVSLTGQIKF